ncbi:MAG: SRPBCC family protein [Actinomycetota bacterium]
MHKTIAAELPADAHRVALVLRDLANYPDWLEIVRRAEPTDGHPGDVGPAWMVTLRAKVGPLARSKRLRMVRTVDAPDRLRFERAEVDGRDHAAWILDARLTGVDPCSVTVELRYEGRLWSAPLEAVLGSQVDDAIPRLRALVR